MKAIALILVILVASSSATSLFDRFPINFSSKRSIMSVLTQVETQLKNRGPQDAVTRLLDDFVVEVTNEQVQHDNLWAEQQVQCAEETGFRNVEIANANAALQEGQATLDSCNSQKVRAVQDYEVTKDNLSQNRNVLAQVEETRRREAYAFVSATEVYTLTSRAVDEALVILEEVWAGQSSFLQLSKHMNKMLKSAVKIRKAHLLTGVMSALAQLASKDLQADEALLDRVKTMLTNFRQKVEEDFQTSAAADQAAVEAYNVEKARLEATVEHLVAQKAALEEELHQLDQCLVMQQGVVFDALQKRDRNQRLLDDANGLCAAIAAEYVSASAQRAEELELLTEIKARVEARYFNNIKFIRFAQMSDYVTQRGEQDSFETEGWQNQNLNDSGF